MTNDERQQEQRMAKREADDLRAAHDVRGFCAQLLIQGLLHVADNQLTKYLAKNTPHSTAEFLTLVDNVQSMMNLKTQGRLRDSTKRTASSLAAVGR